MFPRGTQKTFCQACPAPQCPSIFFCHQHRLFIWFVHTLWFFSPVELGAMVIKSVFKEAVDWMWLFQWSSESQPLLVSQCWQSHFSERTLACLCCSYVGLTRWHSSDHWDVNYHILGPRSFPSQHCRIVDFLTGVSTCTWFNSLSLSYY